MGTQSVGNRFFIFDMYFSYFKEHSSTQQNSTFFKVTVLVITTQPKRNTLPKEQEEQWCS